MLTAAFLAFYNGASGKGALTLWPLFGTINQLLAGLALLIITYYLRRKGKNYWLTLIPALLVLVFTFWAMLYNLNAFYASGNVVCLVIGLIALVIEVWMLIECGRFILGGKAAG